MLYQNDIPVLGIAGFSGCGKTTLIENLIPLFSKKNILVSLIKHAHHDFDLDVPGKDSRRFREAGCKEVLVSSSCRWALVHELHQEKELTFQEQLKKMSKCDLILVEGYKTDSSFPKIEVWRKELGHPVLFESNNSIVAIVTDEKSNISPSIPCLELNNYQEICQFIIRYMRLEVSCV